ncbi:capsular polysaccharide synthesis protein [Lactiplantibacillus sp. WILCCON 0030]|uniref:Capsular polysaccharide synthesis protein n=1 Tax=Lactiplantibacillus brownii TaxID=3069269 RepID=A0ABU1A9Y1_9LACO|nr:capsular polysaccharide synthesis protein [Lactiplantibacillus brownii]MDQ7937735.1 capsular polysaccharide synthesis protein [Lactiplantibacillus brownii]
MLSNVGNRLKTVLKVEGINGVVRRLFPPFFVTNSDLRIIQRNIVTKKKILKANRSLLASIDGNVSFEDTNQTSVIWFAWLQGLENAPELVKICCKQLQLSYPEKKVIVITNDNYSKYVNLPQYIINKWEKGIITNAHFSDLLRLELLINHGGTWIDSTVMCNPKLKDDLYFKSSLFFYSSFLRNDSTMAGSSWFITSAPNNPVLILTRKLLFNYWEHANHLENYFIFHVCFSISLTKYSQIMNQVPIFSNVPAHILVTMLNDNYNDEKFNQVFDQSAFHKLSNKIELRQSKKSLTMYEFIKLQLGA